MGEHVAAQHIVGDGDEAAALAGTEPLDQIGNVGLVQGRDQGTDAVAVGIRQRHAHGADKLCREAVETLASAPFGRGADLRRQVGPRHCVLVQPAVSAAAASSLSPCPALRLDGGNRGHVEHAAGGGRSMQHVGRRSQPEKDRADGDAVGQHFEHAVGDVGRGQVGQDQGVGLAREPGVGEHLGADRLIERGVGVHLALGLQLGRPLVKQVHRLAHLHRRREVVAAEVGGGEQRDLRRHAEAPDLLGDQHGRLAELRQVLGPR